MLVRIIEQYKSLKEYFLKTLPTLPGFKGKNGFNQTNLYQRIKNVLTSKTAFAYMSSIVYVYQGFKEFLVPLQSTEPKIHLLYTECVKFVKDLVSRFMKNDSFMKQTKLHLKEEIIQIIDQEEKCKIYHSYFHILDTLFILYIHQYLPRFNFWKPVPKLLNPPFCSYNIWFRLTYFLVRFSEMFPFFRLFDMEGQMFCL